MQNDEWWVEVDGVSGSSNANFIERRRIEEEEGMIKDSKIISDY
jgi:hypothetical protein